MSYDRYDTSVTKLVQNNPLAFVDRLNEAASIYPGADVFLREAACVIANLLLTDEDWHNDIETGTHDDAIGLVLVAPLGIKFDTETQSTKQISQPTK